MKYYVTVGYDRYERTTEIPFSSYERIRNNSYGTLNGINEAVLTVDGVLSFRNANVNYVHVYKSETEESE